MVDRARDLLAVGPLGGPLWDRLYPRICSDRGVVALGTAHHKQELLQELATSEAFLNKGARVRLRRWFSWVQAAGPFDRQWNTRLLGRS